MSLPVGPAGAADGDLGAFVDALLDQALDLVILRLVDDRADMVAFLGRIVDRLAAEDGGELLDRLLILRAVDEQAGRRDAALAGIEQHAAGAAGQRDVERRAGQDDVRRFAAELLMDALDRVGGVLGDQDAGAGRAGEADHVDVGMLGQRGADAGAVAVDEVEHARRHARRVEHLGEDRAPSPESARSA